MSAHPVPKLTPEEYLALERKAEYRSEYYLGEMFAMAGGSPLHSFLMASMSRELGLELRGSGCRVFASDLRLDVAEAGLYTYPDLMVVCDAPEFSGDQQDMLRNPSLIVEVLSPTTEAYDRGRKFALYRQIPSLQEYLLVSQSEPRVESFRRNPQGDWLLAEAAGMDATLKLAAIPAELRLADL